MTLCLKKVESKIFLRILLKLQHPQQFVNWKLALMLFKTNIPISILTLLISFLLLSLSMIYGNQKLIIPMLKSFYGSQEKYTEMEVLGWKSFLNIQFVIYMGVSVVYFYIFAEWFDLLLKITSK